MQEKEHVTCKDLDKTDIESKKDCKKAADALGLEFHKSINRANDFPGCFKYQVPQDVPRLNGKVWFNKSKGAPNYNGASSVKQMSWTRLYKAICK